MAFDGVPGPSQIQRGSDLLNPYLAANAAKTDRLGRPLVRAPEQDAEIQSVHKEHEQHHDDDEQEKDEPFSEEEAEQLQLFAKMRGLMDFSLETGTRYEFHINPETGLVDLRETETGKVILSLTPQEVAEVSKKIERYAGYLADRSG